MKVDELSLPRLNAAEAGAQANCYTKISPMGIEASEVATTAARLQRPERSRMSRRPFTSRFGAD